MYIKCEEQGHVNMINSAYNTLVEVLCNASRKYYVKKRINNIVGWNGKLSALKYKSRLAARQWHLAGCPLYGDVWENKRRAKKAYRDGLNEHKKGSEHQRVMTLRKAMNQNDSKKFWALWNKNARHKVTSNMHSADDFAKQFSLNFVSKDGEEVRKINEFVESIDNIRTENNDTHMFTVEEVEAAVNDLSLSVSLDCELLCILHILYAHPAVLTCLMMLYNAMLWHGCVPERMGMSIVIPTVKSAMKSANDITNYRPISIMPVISKIFEKCAANVIEPLLKFHENQFGFVNNGGCGKALYTFRSVVNYFREGGSNVYCCSLDIAKAFDRINHLALLKAMQDKAIPLCVIKIFADWWCKLSDEVLWNGNRSKAFSIGSGVPQGSLLGGKFFNLLMDRVLNELQNEGLGCHVDSVFAGAIAYADDLILLSPSVVGMQLMLSICSREFGAVGLIFNISKCVAMVVGKSIGSIVKQLVLYDNELPWVDQMCYLGLVFKTGVKLGIDVSERSRKFIGSVAAVLRGRVAGAEDIYVNVIKTKCLPLLFYGIDCLRLDGRAVTKLSVVWNTAFRWVLGVNRFMSMRTHLRRCGTMSFAFLIDLKLLVFIAKLRAHSTKLLSRLLTWYSTGVEFKGLLHKYGLCVISKENEISQAIYNAFDLHCDV
jgi:Reverse transcriptase (RNA-dependent DNA polymerase)